MSLSPTQVRNALHEREVYSEDEIRVAQEAAHLVFRGHGKVKVWGKATAMEVARGYGLIK